VSLGFEFRCPAALLRGTSLSARRELLVFDRFQQIWQSQNSLYLKSFRLSFGQRERLALGQGSIGMLY
jgi:hypothetical protein